MANLNLSSLLAFLKIAGTLDKAKLAEIVADVQREVVDIKAAFADGKITPAEAMQIGQESIEILGDLLPLVGSLLPKQVKTDTVDNTTPAVPAIQ